MMINPSDWRYASQQVKIAKLIDYKALVFFLVWILHISWVTFYMFLGSVIILFIVEVRWKYQVPAVIRRLSSRLSGKFKPAVTNRRKLRSDI